MKIDWLRVCFKGKCPACGQGNLFKSFLEINDKCSKCGLDLDQHDNGDGPAVFLIFILGFVIVPPGLWISIELGWPLWINTLIWGGIILGASIGLLRPARALVIALQYWLKKDSFDEKD